MQALAYQLLTSLATILVPLIVFAVTSGAAAAANAEAGEEPFAQGRLWMVKKPGGAASYVFGTIHVPDPRVDTLPEPITELVAAVDRLVLEINPKDMRKANAYYNLPGNQTLAQFSDADTLDQVIEYAEYAHLPAFVVLRMRPMALTSILSMPYRVAKRVSSGMKGVDGQLTQLAAGHGIPVIGLETVEEQMSILHELEQGREKEMLRTLAYQRRELLRTYDQIVTAYVAGDVLTYYRASLAVHQKADPEFAAIYTNKMVLGRNRTMAERAAEHLEAGNTMVAVGALHIPGHGGILDLLAKDGYTITRLH